jgi:O-antigen/teichoic acid export membrane protein
MGVFLTSAAVGAYEISWRILTPIFVLTTAVSLTIFPQISAWDANQETDRIERLFPRALTPSLILVVPAFFGAMLLSPEILGLLFGEGFEAAALALPILIAGLIPRAVREITGKTLLGINRPQFVNRAAVVDIAINITLNIILIWQIGLIGAAIATTLSYTIGAGLRWYYLDRYLTLVIPYRKMGWCVISSIGMAITVFTIQQIIIIDSVLRLVGVIGTGVVVYGCLIVLYEPLRNTIFKHTNQLIRNTV